jgi:hypothetical protein
MILRIYMRSGQCLRLRGVRAYDIKVKEDRVLGLGIQRWWWARLLRYGEATLVIDVTQIEAITR